MIYWLIFLILLYNSIKEIAYRRINNKVFKYLWILLVLFVTLRQGQGSDYYNYKQIYTYVDQNIGTVFLLFKESDFGFLIINYIAIELGISFKLFMSLFSLLTMAAVYPFFSRTCNKSIVALFIFFTSSFYLTYIFSAIRQGFVIAVYLGIVFPLIKQKKLSLYYLYIILLSTIHISALVLTIVPFISNKWIGRNKLLILVFISTFLMFIYNPLEFIIPSLGVSRISVYTSSEDSIFKYIPMILRFILIIPVFLIHEERYKNNLSLNTYRNLLVFGYIIYSLFSFSDLISSRMGFYFSTFQIVFFSSIIHNTALKRINSQIIICYLLLSFILLAKDINGYITQGKYENCNIFTYPYFTVFEDESQIQYYRKSMYTLKD